MERVLKKRTREEINLETESKRLKKQELEKKFQVISKELQKKKYMSKKRSVPTIFLYLVSS